MKRRNFLSSDQETAELDLTSGMTVKEYMKTVEFQKFNQHDRNAFLRKINDIWVDDDDDLSSKNKFQNVRNGLFETTAMPLSTTYGKF